MLRYREKLIKMRTIGKNSLAGPGLAVRPSQRPASVYQNRIAGAK
jgi:hypothetical protein